MPIISHRGAKGLGPENSLESISKAASLPISFIEFDIQRTKDDELVLVHDKKIDDKNINEFNASELSGRPKIDEALIACKSIPALIELKSSGCAALCTPYLKGTSHAVTSFLESEIVELKKQKINNTLFIMQRIHPFGLLKKANRIRVNGIGINKNWLLFVPFIYAKTQRNQINLYIYTLNSPFTAAILLKFMPNLYICTDRPDKLTYNK
jgi:glycerophosphoryl diester phosphodiesterase